MVNGCSQSTILVDGFSMVFLHVNHWCRWFFNGFSDFNHWYQWFFQWFFPIQPLPLNEWFCGSPLTLMVYQWFWEKLKLVHKKGQKTKKKHDLFNKYLGVNNLQTDLPGPMLQRNFRKNTLNIRLKIKYCFRTKLFIVHTSSHTN